MRSLVLAVLAYCCASSLRAAEPDMIEPGMSFADAKAILKKHQCEISECQMAIVIRDKDLQLDCGDIDSEIMLMVGHKRSTGKVSSLSVYFIPDGRAPKKYRVVRDARRIVFEDDGAVTLSLNRRKRKTESLETEKATLREELEQ